MKKIFIASALALAAIGVAGPPRYNLRLETGLLFTSRNGDRYYRDGRVVLSSGSTVTSPIVANTWDSAPDGSIRLYKGSENYETGEAFTEQWSVRDGLQTYSSNKALFQLGTENSRVFGMGLTKSLHTSHGVFNITGSSGWGQWGWAYSSYKMTQFGTGIGYVDSWVNTGYYGYSQQHRHEILSFTGNRVSLEEGTTVFNDNGTLTTQGAGVTAIRRDGSSIGIYVGHNGDWTSGGVARDALGRITQRFPDFSPFIASEDGWVAGTGPNGWAVYDGPTMTSLQDYVNQTLPSNATYGQMDLDGRMYLSTQNYELYVLTPEAVPEPGSLIALGFGAIWFLRRGQRSGVR